MGQSMKNIDSGQTKARTGFTQTVTRDQARNCNGISLRSACHKSIGNRIIDVNHALKKY